MHNYDVGLMYSRNRDDCQVFALNNERTWISIYYEPGNTRIFPGDHRRIEFLNWKKAKKFINVLKHPENRKVYSFSIIPIASLNLKRRKILFRVYYCRTS